MTQRQKIGLRKTHSGMHKRGVARRKKLLKAAYSLLCERDIEDISFRKIAKQASVPEGSAYHFYANRFDLFTALAGDLSRLFVTEHRRAIPAECNDNWRRLAEHFVDVGVRVYRNSPPARKLLIGGKTPPEVKHADRMHNRDVARVMADLFVSRFGSSAEVNPETIFYHFIEITDLMLTLSVIEQGEITEEMIREAKFAGVGYLANFFGNGVHQP